jgi:hypothetical protein
LKVNRVCKEGSTRSAKMYFSAQEEIYIIIINIYIGIIKGSDTKNIKNNIRNKSICWSSINNLESKNKI